MRKNLGEFQRLYELMEEERAAHAPEIKVCDVTRNRLLKYINPDYLSLYEQYLTDPYFRDAMIKARAPKVIGKYRVFRERNFDIFNRYFNATNPAPSLRAVGAVYGIEQERVRQITRHMLSILAYQFKWFKQGFCIRIIVPNPDEEDIV